MMTAEKAQNFFRKAEVPGCQQADKSEEDKKEEDVDDFLELFTVAAVTNATASTIAYITKYWLLRIVLFY